MLTIRPFIWFDCDVEEVAKFYTAIFPDSQIDYVSRGDGRINSATFRLCGNEFIAFNGGPGPVPGMGISLFVRCDTQAEVDRVWEALSAGGEQRQCGWLEDQFGVSWQVVPALLGELLEDEDDEKSDRVMAAMLKMTKIDCALLQQAYDET
jgi:predicted 3-demethylubiquinone-9 3-methyltransferase (glyoxalase superfamily)